MSATAKEIRAGKPQSTAQDRHGWPIRSALRGRRARLTARTRLPLDPDTLLITIALGSATLCKLAMMALLSGHGRLGLLTGIPALVGYAIASSQGGPVSEPLDETGKGEVANLSDEEFDRLVERAELAAAEPAPLADEGDHFEQLVRDALDELPEYLQASLADNVAVLISGDADERRYYGLYSGGTVVYGRYYWNALVINRDTLVRDFGHDPDELRRQVTITVRHELAHHLGAGERRVAELGL